jgi:hypothetical protein
MVFSEKQIEHMSESMLLRFIVDWHQLEHPELNSLQALAIDLHSNIATLSNYLAGKGQIGFIQLVKLYEVTKCELIIRWMNAHAGAMIHFSEREQGL